MSDWFVYILKCSDGTLYTGCTVDVAKRLNAHNEGKGAKYTAGRRPVEVLYFEEAAGRSAALIREAKIKKLSRQKKLELAGSITRS